MKSYCRFGLFVALSPFMVFPFACGEKYAVSPLSPASNPAATPVQGGGSTETPSQVPSQTAVVTLAPTSIETPTNTPYVPPPATATSTPANTAVPTATFTSTTVPANSPAFTPSPFFTPTATDTSTAPLPPTATNTPVIALTATPAGTDTHTDTPTHTPTDTRTDTKTPTPTGTPTVTFTPTAIPPGTIVTGTVSNIDSILANAQVPVMIEFWASWCAACTTYSPVVEQFAKDYAGQVLVVRVNCTSFSPLQTEFCTPITGDTYGVPDTVFILNGVKEDEMVGPQTESELAYVLSTL